MVVSYPVVGPAGESPVANGGMKGNRLAVKDERPVRWSNRRYNLVSTAAQTEV